MTPDMLTPDVLEAWQRYEHDNLKAARSYRSIQAFLQRWGTSEDQERGTEAPKVTSEEQNVDA